MKGMRLHKKQGGGFMTALEQTRPDLYKTISQYRTRLGEGSEKQKTFDKRGQMQFAAAQNMPEQMRKDYFESIDKEYATATDKQFNELSKSLESKTFVPTYSYYKPQPATSDGDEPFGPTSGYYRNMQKEIDEGEAKLKGLTITEQKKATRTPYTLQRSSSGAGIAGYTPPPPSKPVYKLPQGYTQEFRTNSGPFNTGGGQTAYGSTAPGQNTGPYGTYQPRDYYVKGRPETYTYDVTRAQKAGDAEYDKLARQLDTYRTRHKYRNLYSGQPTSSSSSSAGIYQKLGMNQAQQVTPFANLFPSTTMKVKEGGEIKGKGKAVRGFKFGGIK